MTTLAPTLSELEFIFSLDEEGSHADGHNDENLEEPEAGGKNIVIAIRLKVIMGIDMLIMMSDNKNDEYQYKNNSNNNNNINDNNDKNNENDNNVEKFYHLCLLITIIINNFINL